MAITGLIVTAALALLAWLWIRRVLIRINAPRSLLKKVAEASDQQINSLIRRRAQLVRDDAYGKPQWLLRGSRVASWITRPGQQ